MAKILTTAIVADIRNKLNGSVFSKNRYGGYVRTKVTPVNPQTSYQAAARAILAGNSSAWRGLSQAQRDGWIAAAPSFPFTDVFGNSQILSGQALYVKLNNNLVAAGEAAISDAPSPIAIPTAVATSLTGAAGTPALSLVFTPTPVPTGFKLLIQATPGMGAGIAFVKNRYRTIGYQDPAATSPADIKDDYVARFGALVAGQRVFVRILLVSTTTGQAGIASSTSAVIAS